MTTSWRPCASSPNRPSEANCARCSADAVPAQCERRYCPAQRLDLADRATSETDRALELRARDRQRKLIAKIDAALARIEDGTYGYCEETGEPIGLKRLDARPIATLSLEAQERHERRERVYRED